MVKIISVEKDVFRSKYILHERLLKYEFALETISPTPFFFRANDRLPSELREWCVQHLKALWTLAIWLDQWKYICIRYKQEIVIDFSVRFIW